MMQLAVLTVPSGVYTINVVPDPTVTIDPAGPLEYCQDATQTR